MLKSILENRPPEARTLDEAWLIIQELSQLVIGLAKRIEQLEEAQDLHSRNSSKPPFQGINDSQLYSFIYSLAKIGPSETRVARYLAGSDPSGCRKSLRPVH